MAVTLGSTGVTFPDATIQTTAAGASGSLIFLSSVTASASSTVDLTTTINSTYSSYMVTVTDVRVSETTNIHLRYRVAGSFISLSNYTSLYMQPATTAAVSSTKVGESFIRICESVSASSGNSLNLTMFLANPSGTSYYHQVYGDGSFVNDTPNLARIIFCGYYTSSAAVDGIRFLPQYGTFTTGTFKLYGIKNS
jgi:hypothetical protein